MIGDLLRQEIEHHISIGKRLARCFITQLFDDRICRCCAEVAQDERLFERLPEFLIDIRPAVEQDVHLLLELIATAMKPA